jgi:hypothetical protein
MRYLPVAIVLLASPGLTFAQRSRPTPPQPAQFEIGRHTFFDFGPPFDFYEIFVVRPSTAGATIERITLTPAADECIAPAKFETASASLAKSVPELLGANPCTIPEKDLRRELKRCKRCVVFSGADVAMQVQCGPQARLIRSAILDRDMFDPAAKTPEQTSWTMQVLQRLDQTVGPGVVDKPIFSMPAKDERPAAGSASVAEQELGMGKYDPLFPTTAEKASELYHAARKPPVRQSVELVSSSPVAPEAFIPPEYPPLAKMAHVHGPVSFSVDLDDAGGTTNLVFESGPKLLYEAVRQAVIRWKFPKDAFGAQIHATIGFGLNCPQSNSAQH